ncbi:hypothetical protein Sjap_003513 [Stephania japonica]|uniref:Receptor-like serine/threonine-protein kinase n=1 Tax=Stephania japonica TaxID=461633 RepID=A0AAP0KQH1_9MAGN
MSTPFSALHLTSSLLFILSFAPHHSISSTATSAAHDTMFAGQSLTINKTLVSRHGKFELGFFTPGNSRNYYIGIWFKQVAAIQKKKTVVWVANRNKPISADDSSSSEFKLLENGHLVLFMSSYDSNSSPKTTVWSTNSTTSTAMNDSSVKAVLGDDGNLVISSSSNRSTVIWQSFDHPTHAFLPGLKLGYNNLTKTGSKLTSWRNSEDPSDGIYSFEWWADRTFNIIWNHSFKFYTSGVWNGRFFSNVPEMHVGYGLMSSFEFTSYNDGSYAFTYFLSNKSLPLSTFMDTSGQTKSIVWSNEAQDWTMIWSKPLRHCQVYGVCGAFGVCRENNVDSSLCQCLSGFKQRYPKDWSLLDYSSGCVRRTTLQCGNNDSFSKMPNIRLPQISPSASALVVDVARKCESACLQNCSCSAYAYDTNSSSSGGSNIRCLLWYANLLNIEQLAGVEGNDLYIRLAPSQSRLGNSRTKSSSRWTIVVVVLSGTTILLGITILFLLKWWRRRLARRLKQESPYAFLTAFRYKDLKIATKNFSNKLGSGSFGSVFKGTLPDSTPVAVKRLEGISQDHKQFRNEVSTIGLIQHVNLVRLRGFCSEGRKILLVYDLMPNGSLDRHLFHQNHSRILNWQQRYQIAIGIARGLTYLHEECRDRIIHCDIKPENVLLDATFSPKIADFGLAKLLGREFSRVVTSMRGTVGYLAPEWTSGVAITAKADVYSYGMMLFEIISGRRNLKQSKDGKTWFFPTWASTKVISEGQPVLMILDNNLEGNADVEELDRAFRVACWCIQEEEFQRPSMGQVVQILEGLLEVNPPPILSYLRAMVETEEPANFFSEIDTSESIQGYENNN